MTVILNSAAFFYRLDSSYVKHLDIFWVVQSEAM